MEIFVNIKIYFISKFPSIFITFDYDVIAKKNKNNHIKNVNKTERAKSMINITQNNKRNLKKNSTINRVIHPH